MKLSESELAKYPPYKKGQAGYDPRQGRFRDEQGNRISRAQFAETHGQVLNGELDRFGSAVRKSFTPQSRQLEEIEDIIGGLGDSLNRSSYRAERDRLPRAWPIPPRIRQAMRWSEYFYDTEGDLAQAFDVPMELALGSPPKIKCPSEQYQKELDELYSEDQLDMQSLMRDMWQCDSVFNNTYPLIIPSNDSARPLAGVILLPPMSVYVGAPYNTDTPIPAGGYGEMPPGGGMTGYGFLNPDEKAWTEQALKSQLHPLAYNSFAPNWNEQKPLGLYIPLRPEYLFPLQNKKQRWQLYAMPSLMKAFNAITTRKMALELRRATFEGYKNQLFIFNVGTPEIPGDPQEVAYLSSLINGASGERTGALVWRGNLAGKVLTMEKIDVLMANETWHSLTVTIFRNLGINMKFVSGENASTVRGSPTSDDLDIQVFLNRLKYKQALLASWERKFRLKLAEMLEPKETQAAAQDPDTKQSQSSLRQAMLDTTVEFQIPVLELEAKIRSYLLPLFQQGAMSVTTLHEQVGLNHQVEVKRRQDEQKSGEDELFAVRASFAQNTVGPDGEKTTASPKGGRPQGATDSEPRVQANLEARAALKDAVTVMKQALNLLRNKQPEPPQVTILQAQPAPVNVTMPDVLRLEGFEAAPVTVNQPPYVINMPEQPAPIVNVSAPGVTVNVPEQQAPIVTVNTPDVTVNVPQQAPPTVNVQSPDVTVNVPEQQPPTVNVSVPKVLSEVTVVNRGRDELIESTEKQFVYEDPE